jgi:hypothetical protein
MVRLVHGGLVSSVQIHGQHSQDALSGYYWIYKGQEHWLLLYKSSNTSHHGKSPDCYVLMAGV